MRKNFIKSIFLSYTLLTGSLMVANESLEHVERKRLVTDKLYKRVDEQIDNLIDYSNYIQGLENNDIPLASITHNIKSLETLNNRLLEIRKGSVDLEESISHLLYARLNNLKKRKLNIDKALEDSRYIHGATHPKFRHNLSPAEKTNTAIIIDTYHTFNFIIVELLSLTDLKKLKPNTKRLIRSSPTLWDKIQKINPDMGHPDEAILNYPEDTIKVKDLYFYENHWVITSPSFALNNYSTFYRNTKIVSSTAYEYYLFNPNSDPVLDIPYPDFLKDHPTIEIRNNEYSAPLDNTIIVTPKKRKKKHKKPSKAAPSPSTANTDTSTIAEVFEQLSTKETLNNSSEDNITPSIGSELPSELTFVKKDDAITSIEKEDLFEIYDTPIDYSIYKEKNDRKKKDHQASPAPQGSTFSSHKDEIREVKGSNHKTLLSLFDPKAYKKVSFKDFKSLWEHIGGTIANHSSGGSHRTIIFKDKIKDGIFKPHGKHRGYAPKTIAKIRKILTEIGYNPIFNLNSI